MKLKPQLKRLIASAAILPLAALGLAACGGGDDGAASAEWGYSGSIGPADWGDLDPAYAQCAQGKKQSPIDITGWVEGDAAGVLFSYSGAAKETTLIHHVPYAIFERGNTMTVDGRSYELKTVHPHTPSEHTVDGEHMAASMHMVHQDDDGNYAVAGVLYRLGEPNPAVQKLIDAAPEPDENGQISLDAAEVVPLSQGYWAYEGSLTTPPCSETVQWVVLREILTVSQEQVDALRQIINGTNYRPVQPIGDRTIATGAV